jgi:hypothetical protein
VTKNRTTMPSSDRPKTHARERRRAGANAAPAARAAGGDVRWAQGEVHARNAGSSDPWDAASAEALTRLYESEEGDLSRPPSTARVVHARPRTQATPTLSSKADGETGAVDRTWLEAHLSRLARRLQDTLGRSDPERSLGVLNDRLDAIEQRFSAALGQVAQRADLDGLRSIEADVMELARQLDRARDRLDRIGAIEDEVRALARRLDETGEQRAAALEKLLRDCIAEWRDGEERTGGALRNLEEAINRLGDSMDAMEASKPAPDLTVPALAATDLERAVEPARPLPPFPVGDWTPPPHFYHAMLDAADYAPSPRADAPPGSEEPEEPAHEPATLSAAAVEWSAQPAPSDFGRPGQATPGDRQIAALRGRLRRSPISPFDGDEDVELPPAAERPATEALKRTSLSLLLMAGALALAGGTYFLYQAVFMLPPRPAVMAPGAPPAVTKPALADPGWRPGQRFQGEGAS